MSEGYGWDSESIGGFGERVASGFYLIGPPFTIRGDGMKEVKNTPDLYSMVVSGRVTGVLDHALEGWDGSQYHGSDEWIGHEVVFFISHWMKHYEVGVDGWNPLDARIASWGQPIAPFWLDWLLARAGFGTSGLSPNDEELQKQVLAILNKADPFPVGVWEGRAGDIERQVFPGSRLLAVFHKLQYYDHLASRPTWVSWGHEDDDGTVRVQRDASFLFRVIAPKQWENTILKVVVNYTIIRGNEGWAKTSENAIFDTFCDGKLGVNVEAFVETLPRELLEEVDVGDYPNLLGPLEVTLQERVEKGHILKIVIPKKWRLNPASITPANSLDIKEISGQDNIVPVPLKIVEDLAEEDFLVAVTETGPGPGPPEMVAPKVIMGMFNNWADFTVHVGGDFTSEGGKWAETYLLPLFEILSLNREDPFTGWTEDARSKAALALADETYKSMCDQGVEQEAKAEYLSNLWASYEQPRSSGF